MKKTLPIFITIIFSLLLAGCGQSGPLYLPPPTKKLATTAQKSPKKTAQNQNEENS